MLVSHILVNSSTSPKYNENLSPIYKQLKRPIHLPDCYLLHLVQ